MNRDDTVSDYAKRDEALSGGAAYDEPFSWRLCALLIFLGSVFCYAIGFGLVALTWRFLATG